MKRMSLFFALILSMLIFSVPQLTHADIIPTPGTIGQTGNSRITQLASGCETSTTGTCISNILNNLWQKIEGFVVIIGLVAVIYLIWHSIRYMTSQGDPKKAAEAKNAIIQVVLAIAIITAAVTIVGAIWGIILELASA